MNPSRCKLHSVFSARPVYYVRPPSPSGYGAVNFRRPRRGSTQTPTTGTQDSRLQTQDSRLQTPYGASPGSYVVMNSMNFDTSTMSLAMNLTLCELVLSIFGR